MDRQTLKRTRAITACWWINFSIKYVMSLIELANEIEFQMDSNSRRRWDDSTLTKEEADALFQSKKEAFIKRERAKEYAFSHRVNN